MFKHDQKLLEMVRVERPNPQYAILMQEQLGGITGELTAAMQYMTQSFRILNPEIKDTVLDIATEELGHMEMVATAVNLLNGHEPDAVKAEIGTIQSQVQAGLLPLLANSSGEPWTANYLDVTGDLPADLLTNIAAEQRAKVTYEYLYRQINDKYLRETIDFLLNREEAHNNMFRECFQKIQDSGSDMSWGVDKDSRLYFNLSKPGSYGKNLKNPQPPQFTSGQKMK